MTNFADDFFPLERHLMFYEGFILMRIEIKRDLNHPKSPFGCSPCFLFAFGPRIVVNIFCVELNSPFNSCFVFPTSSVPFLVVYNLSASKIWRFFSPLLLKDSPGHRLTNRFKDPFLKSSINSLNQQSSLLSPTIRCQNRKLTYLSQPSFLSRYDGMI